MIRIRFLDDETETRALGWLARRFPYKTFKSGETIVPAEALSALAREQIRFTVEGPAQYEQLKPGVPTIRNTPAHPVQ